MRCVKAPKLLRHRQPQRSVWPSQGYQTACLRIHIEVALLTLTAQYLSSHKTKSVAEQHKCGLTIEMLCGKQTADTKLENADTLLSAEYAVLTTETLPLVTLVCIKSLCMKALYCCLHNLLYGDSKTTMHHTVYRACQAGTIPSQ